MFVKLRDLFTVGKGHIGIAKHVRFFKKLLKHILTMRSYESLTPDNICVFKKGEIFLNNDKKGECNYMPVEILLADNSLFMFSFLILISKIN
jgi:hypothetical protein